MNARRTALVVGAFLIGLIGLFVFTGSDFEPERSRLLGNRVPELSGQTLDGESYNIDNSRGNWVLVNFFATWCVGCVREHPELVELEAWGAANGLDVVSVVFDDDSKRVGEFFEQRGGTWPVLQDPSAAIDFQIALIPESFLVSPSGLVLQHAIGGLEADDIIAIIETS
jgi:cytochrome c biogenesis protein CcmG/thiol:disulfide interchange protein DsbE